MDHTPSCEERTCLWRPASQPLALYVPAKTHLPSPIQPCPGTHSSPQPTAPTTRPRAGQQEDQKGSHTAQHFTGRAWAVSPRPVPVCADIGMCKRPHLDASCLLPRQSSPCALSNPIKGSQGRSHAGQYAPSQTSKHPLNKQATQEFGAHQDSTVHPYTQSFSRRRTPRSTFRHASSCTKHP